MRYYIDFQDGGLWLEDDEGQDYESLEAARDAAIAALPDVGRQPPPPDGHRDFVAYVRDERGNRLCTVELKLQAECVADLAGAVGQSSPVKTDVPAQ